jgi:glycosyltransferase involved in cell wall biosynthesis
VNYLLLTPELFANDGGIARILRVYLKALCELAGDGGSVRFLSLNDRILDSEDVRRYSNKSLVEWEICSRSKLRFIRAALRMSRVSDRIICGHVGQLPVAWLASKLRPGLAYYLVAHGIEVWRPFSFLERRAIKGTHTIFCVSDFTRTQLLKRCPLPPKQVAVLHNALDPYLDSPSPTVASDDPPVILSISRLSIADSYKGIGHLIAAMPTIRATIPEVRLRIIGRGDALPGLQSLARKMRMEGAVEFAGYRTDTELKGEFQRCRLFALPSEKEGFGLVYLEAMAHGRPSLGARSGGVPEVITDDTGVLVDYGDVPGIAAAIISALKREWSVGALLDRARFFSFPRFKERLSSLLQS